MSKADKALSRSQVESKTKFKSGKTMATWFVKAWGLSPKERSIIRSKTFTGVAKAMADQWGNK